MNSSDLMRRSQQAIGFWFDTDSPRLRRPRRLRRLDCPIAGRVVELLETLTDGYSRIRSSNKRVSFETLTERLHPLT